MSGLLSRTLGVAQDRTHNLLGGNTIHMGNTTIISPTRGTSRRETMVRMGNRGLYFRGFICVVVGGPRNIVSSASKHGATRGAIVSVLPTRVGQGKLFPTNELSGGAANFVLVASSNTFTRSVLDPGGRVSGACVTRLSGPFPRSTIRGFTQKVRVNNRVYVPTILSTRGRDHALTHIIVERKGCRRIGQVFTTLNYRIISLGEVYVNSLPLSRGLIPNRYGCLSSRRVSGVGGVRGLWGSTTLTRSVIIFNNFFIYLIRSGRGV